MVIQVYNEIVVELLFHRVESGIKLWSKMQ